MAGKTWNKLSSGLPSGDVGRIGLAISPVNPDYVYAVVEAQMMEADFIVQPIAVQAGRK